MTGSSTGASTRSTEGDRRGQTGGTAASAGLAQALGDSRRGREDDRADRLLPARLGESVRGAVDVDRGGDAPRCVGDRGRDGVEALGELLVDPGVAIGLDPGEALA